MRQTLSEFDEHDEGFGLMGEERDEELSPPDRRRLPTVLLGIVAMVLFAGGLWFAYVEGVRHPAPVAQSGGVPLIRADTSPTKVKPEQPGGMKIPDQNDTIYSEKPGGPPVESLLPAPEQPMPRPLPPPPVAVMPPPSPAAPPVAAAPAITLPTPPPPRASTTATAKPEPAPRRAPESRAADEARAILGRPARTGAVRVRLASLRSPDAAREAWVRLKRDNPDLLGRLSAVAVRIDLGDKGIYYRVEAGPVADAAAAQRLCSELRRRKLGCILAR